MRFDTGFRRTCMIVLAGSLALAPLAACEDLPGDEPTQGAVAGGVLGTTAGAVLAGEDNRLVGALIGGVLGAGGGYLIGSEIEKADDPDEDDREDARDAVQRAQRDPATAQDALEADTADLNNDGFVTIDEVVAMERAGLSDTVMIERLEATDQIFELSRDQEQYLAERGVSQQVIDQMQRINAAQRERVLGNNDDWDDRGDDWNDDDWNNDGRGGEVIGEPR